MEPNQPQVHPRYRLIQWSAFLVTGVLLLVGFARGKFHPLQGQLAFCAFGVATGAILVRICHPPTRALTLLGVVSLACVAGSQVFYQMLVWSEPWRVQSSSLGWRLWWVATVMATCLGLLQVLWRSGARWEWNSGRTTLGFTSALGVLLAGLAFRPRLMGSTPDWWKACTALAVLGTIVGSGVIISRWAREHPPQLRRLPAWLKISLQATAAVTILAGTFYCGRITTPPASPFDLMPSLLKALPPWELDRRIGEDFGALQQSARHLDQLREAAESLHASVEQSMTRGGRGFYSPKEQENIRRLFLHYLAERDQLLRLATFYMGYKGVVDKTRRERAYLIGYCAAATALEAGRFLVKRYLDDPLARAKLNEPEGDWLRAGMFDQVYHNVTSTSHLDKFDQHGRLFAGQREQWARDSLFSPEDFEWLEKRIERCTVNIRTEEINPTRALFSRVLARLQEDAYSPIYTAQKLVATFVGDTRIVKRKPFIDEALARQAIREHELRPGDIILQRRNWFLSNAFLPGFWPHAALYIGTPEQLAQLGIEAANAGTGWAAYQTPAQGNPRVIMEAVSSGVVFSSAEYSLSADYVAVLRPRLSPEQIKTALLRAFKHHGKPYDFNFDFSTADTLVCSELVYHAYDGLLDLQTETVMGKEVLTPLGIARKFAHEHGQPSAQLDFVVFLDTAKGAKRAHFATAEACRQSIHRDKAFNE